jgi:hypothetical protein
MANGDKKTDGPWLGLFVTMTIQDDGTVDVGSEMHVHGVH